LDDIPTSKGVSSAGTVRHRTRSLRYNSRAWREARVSITQPHRLRTLLVTGHGGFVGRAVRGAGGVEPFASRWRLATLADHFDIRSAALAKAVAGVRPDCVLHLAGLTSVSDSFKDPEGYFDVNFNGTWNLLRALRDCGFGGRMLFVSSGDCYGAVAPERLPVSEREPLRPRNPYAVSKVAAESLCYQWSQTAPFDVIVARPFNHVGPGQDPRFAVASFARQVAMIRAGRAAPTIATGNLDVTRDLTDVRDVVRAYFALLDSGEGGQAYNVGSGRETSMADVLAMLIRIAGVEADVRQDPARMRADEQRRAAADVGKIRRDTGWSATTPLATTLADTLDDWSERIGVE
jgi:GDP-4-dehydro-6-deoxy-D-mannose reductase